VFASLKDQCGRLVQLEKLPQRILSLVPSQTELLYDLGLEDKLVGITRFCVHPEKALAEKRVVGGTKKVVNKRIIELQPDLIICNKEENTKEIVDFCSSVCPTYVSDISTLEESLEMIEQIGNLTGTTQQAEQLKQDIETSFDGLSNSNSSSGSKLKALYLIWKDPYMSVGGDTFIHDMMEKAGFENVMKDKKRYPQLTLQEIAILQPDVVLLSSEPYNFKNSDGDAIRSAFKERNDPEVPAERPPAGRAGSRRMKAGKTPPLCILTNGELFSWYGSRVQQAPAYFQQLRRSIDGGGLQDSP